ncbi:OmpA family protein [Dokdonella sp.]|uniref:OmpA family protein n=1 Tax=Dokdonella sp. TaxID=2291710 RepID=UPI00260551AC|nr:OmpA family protein [Dokdonella sp.]
MRMGLTALLILFTVLHSGLAKPHSVDFKRVYFPEGKPGRDESSKDLAFILDDEQMKNLMQILAALKERPDLGAKVLGFADEKECSTSECPDLSLRRAKAVFDWLLGHGLPVRQIKGPEGLSTNWPLYGGATSRERRFNRRVDFEPFTISE